MQPMRFMPRNKAVTFTRIIRISTNSHFQPSSALGRYLCSLQVKLAEYGHLSDRVRIYQRYIPADNMPFPVHTW